MNYETTYSKEAFSDHYETTYSKEAFSDHYEITVKTTNKNLIRKIEATTVNEMSNVRSNYGR